MTTKTFDVELRPIDAVRPYEANPRVNDQAVDAVAASLAEFGFRQPIVVDGDGVIIVGHTRWKAAKKLGLAKVPVHVATDLSPEKVKAYRIADNQTATLAEWDFDLLPIELKDLQAADYDLDLLGFDEKELAKLLDGDLAEGLTDPDSVPEPPDDPITQRGDIWVLGDHRLMCGDSGSPEDLNRLLDGATIDLVAMDPPYNVKVEPRSSTAIAAGNSSHPDLSKKMHHQGFDVARGVTDPKKARKKMRAKDRPLENDFVSDDAFDEMLLAWFGNASRVLKPGGSFYIWGGYGTYPSQKRAFFTLRDVQKTLGRAAPGTGLEGSIYAGLEKLTEEYLTRRWRRDDGAELPIERCLIDANWGQSTDVVYQFCRQSAHSAIVMPSHGRYVGASSVPFSEYKRKRGERVGHHWRIPNTQGRRQVRHVLIDTNYWKSFIHARLGVAMGDPGCLSLFGRAPADHQLLAEHLTAEYRVRTEARGRVVDEWKLRAGAPDNHWLDCLVGCAVAASIGGAVLPGTDGGAPATRQRIRLSEVQRRSR